MSTLQIRLKNCLQTILELEPQMRAVRGGRCFDKELNSLKGYLQQVDSMPLAEDDVQRLERATATFLEELKSAAPVMAGAQRVLQ